MNSLITSLLLASVIVANNAQSALKVVTLLNPPYAVQSADGKISGFLVDLLDLIAPIAGVTYSLSLQPDALYGAKQGDGSWNGLVGSLVSKSADVVAADLTITSDRDAVIDFTTPYLVSPLRILVGSSGLNNIHYLVVKDTAFATYLQQSPNATVQAIWADIQANNGLVADPKEGVNKVLSGGFAFVEDYETLNPFLAANRGKIQLDGSVLWSTDFLAFGVQNDSPLRDQLSKALEQVNEKGRLQDLFIKYNLN
jgi:ABC-type amino acid transport substrate-binding protein